MTKRKLTLGLIACLTIGMLVSRTVSQPRGGFGGGSGFTRPRVGSGGSSGGRSGGRSSRVTDESKEASWRGAVGATEQQWSLIKPKLEKVKQLKREARMGIVTAGGGAGGSQSRSGYQSGSGFGFGGSGGGSRTRAGYRSGVRGGAGGSGFSRPMGTGATSETRRESNTWMTWNWYRSWGSEPPQREDEKACESLFSLLKRANANPQVIQERMDVLKRTREQRSQELTEARKELRELLTLDQEARLVALGWLD